MLTDHPVTFNPFENGQTPELLEAVGELRSRVIALGGDESDTAFLASGVGTISGRIPMICFTEVHDGRDLRPHYLNFGAYGLVVSQDWLEANGGGRVVYAGAHSEVTKRLYRLFVAHQLNGLHVNNGKVMFSNTLVPILDLLAYVQGRDQLPEVEWRIAGEHGFTGRKRANGERIALSLEAVQTVLVQSESDVAKFTEILKSLPGALQAKNLPPVVAQPEMLPKSNWPYGVDTNEPAEQMDEQ